MICHGRSGDTSNASIVPVSFSRVSEIAVISDEMIVSTNAISPGTNRFELARVGLNRIRTLGTIRRGARDEDRDPRCAVRGANWASCSKPCTTALAYEATMLPV